MNKIAIYSIFVFVFFIILFINYYPHYYGHINTPKNYFYSGQASWFDPWDINNYFSIIKSSQKNKTILLSNVNTTQKTKPVFLYPIYTLTATIFPTVNNILLYQVMTILCGILLLVAIFIFANLIIKNVFYSLYSVIIISLGGGIGFLLPLNLSSDLSIPGVMLFSSFQKPHEAISVLLYIAALIFYFIAIRSRKKIYICVTIFLLLIIIPIHFYRIFSFLFVTGVYSVYVFLKNQKKYAAFYFLVCAGVIFVPTVLYILHFLNSGFSSLAQYNPNRLSLSSIFFGYGIFMIFFMSQLFFYHKKNPEMIFLNFWIILSFLLSILPLGVGRLFLSSIIFPIGVLLTIYIKREFGHIKYFAIFVMSISLILSIPSSLFIFDKRIKEVHAPNIWYYFPKTWKYSFDFLIKSERDGVLAVPPISQYISAFTGKHVYIGIKDQTPDFNNRLVEAEKFYSGQMTLKEADAFLTDNNISYIFSQTDSVFSKKNPYPFMINVYKNKDVEIFAIP